jgi:hypothetical protein
MELTGMVPIFFATLRFYIAFYKVFQAIPSKRRSPMSEEIYIYGKDA